MAALSWRVETSSPEGTEALGGRIGRHLEPGDLLGLTGDLGSGKTCLVRGICRGLEVRERVTSPSFLTVNEYRGRLPVYHMDLFRVERVDDLRAHGYDEMIFGPGITVIEWNERIAHALPEERLDVGIEITGRETRRLTFYPRGSRGLDLLEKLRSEG